MLIQGHVTKTDTEPSSCDSSSNVFFFLDWLLVGVKGIFKRQNEAKVYFSVLKSCVITIAYYFRSYQSGSFLKRYNQERKSKVDVKTIFEAILVATVGKCLNLNSSRHKISL